MTIRRGTTCTHHRYGRGITTRDQERTPLGRLAADLWVLFDADVARGWHCERKVLASHLTLEVRAPIAPMTPPVDALPPSGAVRDAVERAVVERLGERRPGRPSHVAGLRVVDGGLCR